MRIKYHTDRNTVVLAVMPVAVIMVDGGVGGGGGGVAQEVDR